MAILTEWKGGIGMKHYSVAKVKHKNALVIALLFMAVVIAVKWGVIGYYYGKHDK